MSVFRWSHKYSNVQFLLVEDGGMFPLSKNSPLAGRASYLEDDPS